MMKLVLFALLALVASALFGTVLLRLPSEKPVTTSSTIRSQLDGAYVFHSRSFSRTYPQETNEETSLASWKSIWIFSDGYFSISGMNVDRSNWTPRVFPATAKDIRFDGKAGKFRVESKKITFTNLLSFYPGQIQSVDEYEFEIRETDLVLSRKLGSTREDLSSGVEIIILKKVSE